MNFFFILTDSLWFILYMYIFKLNRYCFTPFRLRYFVNILCPRVCLSFIYCPITTKLGMMVLWDKISEKQKIQIHNDITMMSSKTFFSKFFFFKYVACCTGFNLLTPIFLLPYIIMDLPIYNASFLDKGIFQIVSFLTQNMKKYATAKISTKKKVCDTESINMWILSH